MASILLTWEMGGGWGHLMTLKPFARGLAARGHRIYAALRDLSNALEVFGEDVILLQAPLSLRSTSFDPARPTTLSHILANNGFSEPAQLAALCQAWRAIFEYAKPDLILSDHSPTALLAARSQPFKRCTIGTGFFSPPDECPLPNLRYWVQHDPALLRRDEDALLQTINAQLIADKAPPLSHVARLYADVDAVFLTTVRELDHYPQRPSAEYWGEPANEGGDPPIWPDGGRGPRVYAYLKSFDTQSDLLTRLNELKVPSLVYSECFDAGFQRQFASSSLQFVRGRLDLAEVGRQCDLAILHGTHGSTLAMLLAGKPSLQLPISLEQILVAQAVRRLGASLCAPIDEPRLMLECLHAMLESKQYELAARKMADKYVHLKSAPCNQPLLERLESVLSAPRSAMGAAMIARPGLDADGIRDLQANTTVLHGPDLPHLERDELLVLCTVRNGELFIKSFMDHYLALGASHFVILDNGSSDRTVELCRGYPRVTVLQTTLDYKRYYHAMSQFLLERFGPSKWCLVVDIDELFEAPFIRELGLKGFLRYLNHHFYTAVCAQMLDMFCDQPLCEIVSAPQDSLKEKYPFYELGSVMVQGGDPTAGSAPLVIGNTISNPNIRIFKGGIRKSAFGLGSVLLTKHPLVFYEPPLVLSHPHFVSHARIADVSCALFHYKFLGSFIAYTKESVDRENHWNSSAEYKCYAQALHRNPRLNLRTDKAVRFRGMNHLIERRFLTLSRQFITYVDTACPNTQNPANRLGDAY